MTEAYTKMQYISLSLSHQ